MIRLMKMELYRMFHAVSTYVMILVVAGVTVLMAAALKWDLEEMEQEQKMSGKRAQTETDTLMDSFTDGFADGWDSEKEEQAQSGHNGIVSGMITIGNEDETYYAFGISAEADESWVDGDIDVGEMLLMEMQSGMLLLFIAIFAPLLVHAEQKKGYIKNIAGQIPRREMLSLSKLPAVAVQVFLIICIFCVTHVTASAVIFGDRLAFSSAAVSLRTIGVQLLLHMSWGCLIALFVMASRSMAFSMVTGIFLSSGIFELIGGYLNRAIHAIIPAAEQFDIRRYTLTYVTGALSNESTGRQIGGFLAVAAVYVIVSAVVSGIVYRKRDVIG
ncbi:MAG: hypothetical protein NC409_01905 [Clostridium sp.]|nr:hypothetical protein [Clostridium sp.]